MRHMTLIPLLAMLVASCAGLTQLSQFIQPPRFAQADGQPAEIRFLAPSRTMPAGGAGVRIWLEVTNPNPFAFTLSTLDVTLALDGSRAASGNFPLGLPLGAVEETVVPVDLAFGFAD